jgi:hypothetical protein
MTKSKVLNKYCFVRYLVDKKLFCRVPSPSVGQLPRVVLKSNAPYNYICQFLDTENKIYNYIYVISSICQEDQRIRRKQKMCFNTSMHYRWHLVWDNEVFSHHGQVSFLLLDQIKNTTLWQTLNTRFFHHHSFSFSLLFVSHPS